MTTKTKRSEVSFSERRLRQVRMAAAVFGRGWEVHYPATREGFKSYWQHARIRARAFGTPWLRALPEARFKGNHFRPQRDLSGKARMGFVYPDRVWLQGHEEWSFRYHLLTDAAFEVFRDEWGGFDARKHHNAVWKLMRYHTGTGAWGSHECLYCERNWNEANVKASKERCYARPGDGVAR